MQNLFPQSWVITVLIKPESFVIDKYDANAISEFIIKDPYASPEKLLIYLSRVCPALKSLLLKTRMQALKSLLICWSRLYKPWNQYYYYWRRVCKPWNNYYYWRRVCKPWNNYYYWRRVCKPWNVRRNLQLVFSQMFWQW